MSKHEKQKFIEMDVAQIKLHAEEIRKELFLLRMKKFSSPDKNTALPRILRKKLAKALTAVRQKESYGN
ncbi:50S ribosomal protein L29 [Candidatus Babeliales bacterium]|nr:50S ribosomal protein L29 [Candidatus Babeliales bacterium]